MAPVEPKRRADRDSTFGERHTRVRAEHGGLCQANGSVLIRLQFLASRHHGSNFETPNVHVPRETATQMPCASTQRKATDIIQRQGDMFAVPRVMLLLACHAMQVIRIYIYY